MDSDSIIKKIIKIILVDLVEYIIPFFLFYQKALHNADSSMSAANTLIDKINFLTHINFTAISKRVT